MDNTNLYNYIFWFNPYEDLWYAIERNTELFFFNGSRNKAKYYKSKEHSTLVTILIRNGLIEKITNNGSEE